MCILIGAIFLARRIYNLGYAQPHFPTGDGNLEAKENDSVLTAEECSLVMASLRERLWTILKAFAAFMTWFVCYWLMFTVQRIINIFDLDDSDSRFNVKPVTTIVQLSLEFIFSIFIILAICFAQKKRFGESKHEDANSPECDAETKELD